MIDAEKILGGLLKNSMGDMPGLGNKSAVGLGLLGVAIAAAEHFMEKREAAPPPPPGGFSRPNAGPVSSPPPPPGSSFPVPGTRGQGQIPPPPPGTATASPPDTDQAVLLVRAMIASANADNRIDQEEKRRIMLRLEALDLSEDEKRFLERELARPLDMDAIIEQVSNPELARKVYAVSLLAIEVDTEEEERYLKELAIGLGLDENTLDEIHAQIGIPRT